MKVFKYDLTDNKIMLKKKQQSMFVFIPIFLIIAGLVVALIATDGNITNITNNVDENEIDRNYYTTTYNEDESQFTAILFVSQNGDDTYGSSWSTAFCELEDALDEASTDANNYTLILVAPGIYDFNRSSPIWNCNVKIVGIALKSDVRIINTHSSTEFVAKFTRDIHMKTLHIYSGTQGNGIIVDQGSAYFENIMILSTGATQVSTVLTLNRTKYIYTDDVVLDGVSNLSTSLKLVNTNKSRMIGLRIYNSIVGINISDSICNLNFFENINLKYCGTAVYIYENAYHNSFHQISFFGNIVNINDNGNFSVWEFESLEFDNRYTQMFPENASTSANIISSSATENMYGDWEDIITNDSISKPYAISSFFLTNASADGVFMIQLSYIRPHDLIRITFTVAMIYVETGVFSTGVGVTGQISSGLIPANTSVQVRLERSLSGIGNMQIWLQYIAI